MVGGCEETIIRKLSLLLELRFVDIVERNHERSIVERVICRGSRVIQSSSFSDSMMSFYSKTFSSYLTKLRSM